MLSLKRFWLYCWGAVSRPGRTLEAVAAQKEKVAYGCAAVLLLTLPYSALAYIAWSRGITPSGYTPLLRIPLESYYLWRTFLAVPVGLVGWILYAGSSQLICRALGGSGSFEGNLAVLGFPYVVLLPLSWFPEFASLFLPEAWGTAINGATGIALRMSISVAWFAGVSLVGLRQAQRLSIGRSLSAVILSLLPTIALQMTYLH